MSIFKPEDGEPELSFDATTVASSLSTRVVHSHQVTAARNEGQGASCLEATVGQRLIGHHGVVVLDHDGHE
jgi:hypothetical protein